MKSIEQLVGECPANSGSIEPLAEKYIDAVYGGCPNGTEPGPFLQFEQSSGQPGPHSGPFSQSVRRCVPKGTSEPGPGGA